MSWNSFTFKNILWLFPSNYWTRKDITFDTYVDLKGIPVVGFTFPKCIYVFTVYDKSCRDLPLHIKISNLKALLLSTKCILDILACEKAILVKDFSKTFSCLQN